MFLPEMLAVLADAWRAPQYFGCCWYSTMLTAAVAVVGWSIAHSLCCSLNS